MDINSILITLPELKPHRKALEVVEIMAGYARDKTPVDEAMLEVRTVKKWNQETIQAACEESMSAISTIYQNLMEQFSARTETEIDAISLAPFKKRYQSELLEHEKLKKGGVVVTEMTARIATAKNFTLPASQNTSKKGPRVTFSGVLKAMKIVEGGTTETAGDSPWLVEPTLKEDADDVQLVALIDKKNATGGIEAVNTFMAKLKLSDKELEKSVLSALADARAQIALSDSIIQSVADEYAKIEAKVNAIITLQNEIASANSYSE